jgi:hypothetical protein
MIDGNNLCVKSGAGNTSGLFIVRLTCKVKRILSFYENLFAIQIFTAFDKFLAGDQLRESLLPFRCE